MACDVRSDVSEKNLDIVCSTLRGEVHLLTLEALWIRDMKPSINVKDEYKSRELVIKFWGNKCLELIRCTINVLFFSYEIMMMMLCIEKYSTVNFILTP